MTFEVTILSGKGGTGKTSVTAAFAQLAHQEGLKQVLCDLDVDASNLPILLNPTLLSRQDFISGEVAVLDRDKCRDCGRCVRFCRFDALKQLPRKDGQYRGEVALDPVACEGCRVCVQVCNSNAISMEAKTCGVWFQSDTQYGAMFHADLTPGEENSGRLITLLRQNAATKAAEINADLILSDGPPGIGCPAISSVSGTGCVVCVTEPTASGLHDLRRAIDLGQHFNVPMGIIINKYGLNPDVVLEIAQYAEENGLPILGRIPYSDAVMASLVQGKTLMDVQGISDAVLMAWRSTSEWIKVLRNTSEAA